MPENGTKETEDEEALFKLNLKKSLKYGNIH